jgi:hypothetical protein
MAHSVPSYADFSKAFFTAKLPHSFSQPIFTKLKLARQLSIPNFMKIRTNHLAVENRSQTDGHGLHKRRSFLPS